MPGAGDDYLFPVADDRVERLVARDDVLRLSGKPVSTSRELTLEQWATRARRFQRSAGGTTKFASLASAPLPTWGRRSEDSRRPVGEVAESAVEAQLAAWPAADLVGRLQYVPCPRRGTHLRLVDCWMCWCDEHRARSETLAASERTVIAGDDRPQSAA